MNNPGSRWTPGDTIAVVTEVIMSFLQGVLYLTLITLGIVATLGLSTCETQDLDNDDWTTEQGDCNDLDPATYPGATELCDDVDQNCDGEANEGCPEPTPSPPVCCKVCTTGLACGDTCIDPDEVCHEAPGCACQGEP